MSIALEHDELIKPPKDRRATARRVTFALFLLLLNACRVGAAHILWLDSGERAFLVFGFGGLILCEANVERLSSLIKW